LARSPGCATLFTDSAKRQSFAHLTADSAYARLMRARSEVATGSPKAGLEAWAGRAREWAKGGEPGDLPRISAEPAPRRPRDVFVFFIAAAKERNPAADMALLAALGGD